MKRLIFIAFSKYFVEFLNYYRVSEFQQPKEMSSTGFLISYLENDLKPINPERYKSFKHKHLIK